MKILYITNGICGVGGLERVLSIKASWLSKQNDITVAICSINEKNKRPFYSFSENIIRYNIEVNKNPIIYIYSYIKSIKKIIKEYQPDIISVCDDGLKGLLILIY